MSITRGELLLTVSVLTQDQPSDYVYVRHAHALRQALHMGVCTLQNLGLNTWQFEMFMKHAIYAQAWEILTRLKDGECLVHPILVDPDKLMTMLMVLGLSDENMASIRPAIYRLAGSSQVSPVTTPLLRAQVHRVLAGRSTTLPAHLRQHVTDIAACLDDQGKAQLGVVIKRITGERSCVRRATVVKQVHRTVMALKQTPGSPLKIVIIGAKVLGDKREIVFYRAS